MEIQTEPHVGIFWLLDGKPVIDSTPLSKAEPYGDHMTHPVGHAEVWERLQGMGKAPVETDYDEPPRVE